MIKPESTDIDGGLYPIKTFSIACPVCRQGIHFMNAEHIDPDYHEWMENYYRKEVETLSAFLFLTGQVSEFSRFRTSFNKNRGESK